MKMKLFKALTLTLAATLTLGALSACGGGKAKESETAKAAETKAAETSKAPEITAAGGGSDAKKTTAAPAGDVAASDTLTIYTALPDSEIPFYVEAFERDTGIKIQYVRLSAGEMLARVESEAGNPQAAMMHGGPSDTYVAGVERGLFEPYQSPELANIDSRYHDPKATWNPFYIGAIGFCINTEWFEENKVDVPKSWDDLLKPEFKDQVMMAHPSASGTAYTMLATILQLKGEDGWEYMKKLNENIRQYTKSGAAPANSAGLGEAAVGIVFSHDGLKPKEEGYPVEVVFPSDGTGYEIGAMAIIKGADPAQQAAAKKFIDWSMSKAGQEAYIESKSNRLPLNQTAAVTPGLTQIKDLPVIEYDATWAGEHKAEFLEKFNEVVAKADNLKQ